MGGRRGAMCTQGAQGQKARGRHHGPTPLRPRQACLKPPPPITPPSALPPSLTTTGMQPSSSGISMCPHPLPGKTPQKREERISSRKERECRSDTITSPQLGGRGGRAE